MKRFASGLIPVLFALLCVSELGACSRRDDGTTPSPRDLPALEIRDDTPNLLLTWVDEKGDAHNELHPADVPFIGRDLVRVVLSDREDGTRDPLYVVDLRQAMPGGGYAAATMPRAKWESEIERRREAYRAKTAPPAPTGSDGTQGAPTRALPSGRKVVIYGASWCKPCHQAADYMKSKGIPYVLEDIEQNPKAQAEMQQKLLAAGRGGGSIPVIDVAGELLIGYSPEAIDRAWARAASGTKL
jgi:glutaredoxin